MNHAGAAKLMKRAAERDDRPAAGRAERGVAAQDGVRPRAAPHRRPRRDVRRLRRAVEAPVQQRALGHARGRGLAVHEAPPFSFAGEDEHFAAARGVATWTIEGVRGTPLVCYDLRFPEPFRLAADGTDLFAVVANWPERRRAHWQLLLKARAVENLCYVAGVNRVGEDGNGNRHMGDSSVTSPWGETLVSAAETETLLVADVDAAVVADACARFPVLKDRRPSYAR